MSIAPLSRYFATCARGLEPVLARELAALNAANVQPGRGGVAFAGDRALLYKANLWLRTAIRVLMPILETPVYSPDELYQAVQTIDWQQHLTLEHTFAVDCNVRDSQITHSHFAALRTKDAICDQFVARCGKRPSIDTESPMLKLNLHIYKDQMVLSLDSSGESLHKRGYRGKLVKAPLNEALAAGLILLTGWDGQMPFADPLCGSGTLPIEACWIALHRPPQLTRKRFGFHGWMGFEVAEWMAIRDEARQQVRKELSAPIVGSDVRRDAIALARECTRAAGVGHLVELRVGDVGTFALPPPVANAPGSPSDGPGSPGVILCNPPYGERLGEERELRPLYRSIGAMFRRASGYATWLFTANAALEAEIGLEAVERIPLYNGRIPCRLMRFAGQ